MKTEKAVFDFLKGHFDMWHWQRIENSVSSGLPDCNVGGCLGGDIWIELKIGKPRLRPAQVAWFAGAGLKRRAFVLCYDPKEQVFAAYKPPFFVQSFVSGKFIINDTPYKTFTIANIDSLPLCLT